MNLTVASLIEKSALAPTRLCFVPRRPLRLWTSMSASSHRKRPMRRAQVFPGWASHSTSATEESPERFSPRYRCWPSDSLGFQMKHGWTFFLFRGDRSPNGCQCAPQFSQIPFHPKPEAPFHRVTHTHTDSPWEKFESHSTVNEGQVTKTPQS